MRQLLLDFTQAPAPTFANFVPGGNAELAHAIEAAIRGEIPERVVYLWGEPAAGKTHLLKAFAAAGGGLARYVPARDFMDAGNAIMFAVDDVEQLTDEEQVSLFNAYNERTFEFLRVSANAAPKDVAIRKDLATRLATGLTYRVLPLTDEEKRTALAAHARQRGFAIPEEVSSYLLTHARRDMGSLMAALDSLDRYSLETGRAITVPLLKEALAGGRMKIALFDLDNTLLDGDSDHAWAEFLIEEGVLHPDEYHAKNEWFFERYKDGTLDIHEFLDFQLAPIAHRPRSQLDAWHVDFMRRKIRPMILPKAVELIASHAGAQKAIVTATNRFITAPIARELGIANLIATDIEEVDGAFTGKPRGTPNFREGKVERVDEWLRGQGCALADCESWFYSDSLNDLPLLEKVTHPVAVDPDETLRSHATGERVHHVAHHEGTSPTE